MGRREKYNDDEICKEAGCHIPAKVRGYCRRCYQKKRREGAFEINSDLRQNFCKESGCEKLATKQGYCHEHYEEAVKLGKGKQKNRVFVSCRDAKEML